MVYAGVDIGGTNIKIGLVDDNGNIIVDNWIKTDKNKGFKGILVDIIDDIRTLCKSANLDFESIQGIGLGIPGVVDAKKGLVKCAANIGWENIEIVKELSSLTGKKVCAGNDANCAAWGEYKFGAGVGSDNAILITLGTGVGSGIIIDGNLFEGVASAGAEAGHMIIVKDGKQCSCGLKGCWECYASATALVSQTQEAIINYPYSYMAKLANKQGKITGRTAFIALEHGDEVAKHVVDNYINYLVTGLISLGNVFHPDVFIMGGGVSNEGEALLSPLQKLLNDGLVANKYNPPVRVVKASLGNKAGLIGAAALVM